MSEAGALPFFHLFLFLFVPFVFGFLLKRIGISPIIGYIVGGVFMGNVSPLLGDVITLESVEGFAEFGIVLLLFTIGLEINFVRLYQLKRYILFGGLFQVLFSIVGISIVSLFFSFSPLQAILIGIALTSSSTAVVAKIIQDRGESDSFVGEVALGILMFQDLAFIPFIIIFTSISGENLTLVSATLRIAWGLIETLLIIAAMYFIGKRILPYVFHKVARSSRELMNLFVFTFIFFIISASNIIHLPVLIGAFIAGILVSETIEHVDVFVQVRPVRDVMAIVFFVYVGMHIRILEVVDSVPSIFLFALIIVAIKLIIITAIFLYFRLNTRVAFSLGVFLFQVSENGFILLTLGFANGLFTTHEYLFLLSAILLSLLFTPFAINQKDLWYVWVRSFIKKYAAPVNLLITNKIDFVNPILSEQQNLKDHVVICGYGRVGSRIGRAMQLANIPFIAIDYNFHEVQKAKREGVNIMYGDPADIDILRYAHVGSAKAIVVAIPARRDQEMLVMHALSLNSKIMIIGRAHSESDRKRLKDIGVHWLVVPEVEASLSAIRKLFSLNNIDRQDMQKWLRHLKVSEGLG